MECDICYEEMKNKVSLECNHELCLKCFMKMIEEKEFKCHMCRKKYEFESKPKLSAEERLIDLIIENTDDEDEDEPRMHFEDVMRSIYRLHHAMHRGSRLHRVMEQAMQQAYRFLSH